MVKHGAISRSHVYQMLGSKDARVRRAAFTLLEVSNPRLRRDGELFMEIIRFIWDANPSYDVYREFSKRHLFVPYKVQELIGARIKIEKREEQSAPTDHRTEDARKAGFFKRLFRRRTMQSRTRASDPAEFWPWRLFAFELRSRQGCLRGRWSLAEVAGRAAISCRSRDDPAAAN
jgi:hypothetical protein